MGSGCRGEWSRLRLEELIESLGPQTGFQFLVIGPEPGVEVQGQGDERGVFQVHPVAKAAGLHLDADRNARGLHKLERFEEFIEGFEDGGGCPNADDECKRSRP